MIVKKDFIEIEFVGKSDEGKIFDTNIEKIAKENKLYAEEEKERFKPLKVCVGENMLVAGFDKALEGKELDKEYKIELKPKDAFGERNSQYIKTVSVNSFRKSGMEPVAGMVVSLDNVLARIAAVSGGRVIIDLNNPLAGKNVIYEFKILKKIDNEQEKIEIAINMLLGLNADVKIAHEGDKKIAKIWLDLKIPEKVENKAKERIKELTNLESEFLVKEKSKPEEKEEIKDIQ